MALSLTIHPPAIPSLSPAQQRQAHAPDVVNDDFLSGFADFLDIVNPLQQLPLVSTLYREVAEDPISHGARILGGALLGGPIGFAVAMTNTIVESATGKDIGGHLYAAVAGKYEQQQQMFAKLENKLDHWMIG